MIVFKCTKQITFEVHDEHPQVGDYCVFGDEKPEGFTADGMDFAFVQHIMINKDGTFVISPDLYAAVKLEYCWKLTMEVHNEQK